MKSHPFLLASMLGLASFALLHAPPADARTYASVRVAPPPPRFERVVVRPGYAWVPGYWRWEGRRYVWVSGYYTAQRARRAYVPARWYRVGPEWRFRRGYWGHR